MDIETTKLRMELATEEINNPNLRRFVLDVLDKLPDMAWYREASLKYHHPDEREAGGNVLHEIRTAVLADIIADVCDLTLPNRDLVRAASLLHDCCRHGAGASEKWTIKNHANIVRAFIEANDIESEWTNPVCTIIETHMSRWGAPPRTPQISLQDVLILADFITSQPNVEVHE